MKFKQIFFFVLLKGKSCFQVHIPSYAFCGNILSISRMRCVLNYCYGYGRHRMTLLLDSFCFPYFISMASCKSLVSSINNETLYFMERKYIFLKHQRSTERCLDNVIHTTRDSIKPKENCKFQLCYCNVRLLLSTVNIG